LSAFVDTSGLLALLDAADAWHARADAVWRRLVEERDLLVTSNYVLLETIAVAQSRLGLAAARAVHDDVVPVLQVLWVDAATHQEAMAALLTAGRRRLSLVDCVSFVLMRKEGLRRAFAFDRHFADQGFELLR
jgi:predicted nucleic acid-binding protein